MTCSFECVAATEKKNDILTVDALNIKEGETSPPKRYNSGSMILAMENAGQLIEDEGAEGTDQGKWNRDKCNKSRDS